MLNFDEFVKKTEEDFINFFPYKEYKAQVDSVCEVNVKTTRLFLVGENEDIILSLNLDELYKEYVKSENLILTFQNATRLFTKYLENMKDEIIQDEAEIDKLFKSKENIVLSLINTERNKELLETIPHSEFLDLSIVYHIFMGKGNDISKHSLITNEALEELGISNEELFDIAYNNSQRLFPVIIKNMEDIVLKYDKENESQYGNKVEMYVLYNDSFIFGDMYMLCQDKLLEVANKMNDNVLIIPSSINELLVVPEEGVIIANLLSMIHSINVAETKQSFLSDNLYKFDRESKKVSLVQILNTNKIM